MYNLKNRLRRQLSRFDVNVYHRPSVHIYIDASDIAARLWWAAGFGYFQPFYFN